MEYDTLDQSQIEVRDWEQFWMNAELDAEQELDFND